MDDKGVKKREPLFWINPRTRIECDHFFVEWQCIEDGLLASLSVSKLRYAHKSGIIEVVIEKEYAGAYFLYTKDMDFTNLRLQTWLRRTLRDIIIARANIVLPARLHYWEKMHNLYAKSVAVKKLRKHVLGQCYKLTKHIDLSPTILLFPSDLMDSVIMHEMAHLKYAHHRKSFWNFLTTLLGEDSEQQKTLCDLITSKNMMYQQWLFNDK